MFPGESWRDPFLQLAAFPSPGYFWKQNEQCWGCLREYPWKISEEKVPGWHLSPSTELVIPRGAGRDPAESLNPVLVQNLGGSSSGSLLEGGFPEEASLPGGAHRRAGIWEEVTKSMVKSLSLPSMIPGLCQILWKISFSSREESVPGDAARAPRMGWECGPGKVSQLGVHPEVPGRVTGL